jgi:hypothetical protein
LDTQIQHIGYPDFTSHQVPRSDHLRTHTLYGLNKVTVGLDDDRLSGPS